MEAQLVAGAIQAARMVTGSATAEAPPNVVSSSVRQASFDLNISSVSVSSID
jgi:hypothetical protein